MLEAWAGRAKDGMRLWNTYGVTECCVYNSARVMAPGDAPNLLGAPLPGNLLFLAPSKTTDELEASEEEPNGWREVLPGEVGELVIAGAQVGQGYAKRPELSARCFPEHPSLGRVYLTGDLAREDKGGMCLLGRRDHQVKIRGHRIELAEVEHWLLAAAGSLVRGAAAACLQGRLVAFCVPAEGLEAPKAAGALRAALRWLAAQEVPGPMRPQRYELVAALPLTSSGKLARGKLEALLPTEVEAEEVEAGGPPITRMEAVVAEAWASELAQPAGSIQRLADFTELGGHSIVALRICRQLALRLGEAGVDPNADKDDAALGGDLGELSGPLAPHELLRRPRLADYAAHLAAEERLARQAELLQEVSIPNALAFTASPSTCAAQPSCMQAGDVETTLPAGTEMEVTEGGGMDGVALLHRAAIGGAIPLIEFLVARGVPVDGHCSMKRLKAATRAQRSLRHVGKDGPRPPAPLHSAAASGAVASVAALLSLRASVTATEAHGVMALHLAAGCGPADVVSLLLSASAPLAARDANLQTALHFGARAGGTETLGLLLGRWTSDEALMAQGTRAYGGPLDWRDRWHRTPVHWAALNDHVGALKALLEARASAEPPRVAASKHAKSTSLRHESPLEIAQRRGHREVEELLIGCGAAEGGACGEGPKLVSAAAAAALLT